MPPLLQIPSLITEVENISGYPGLFLPISSSLRLMSGANFPPIVAWNLPAKSGSPNLSRSNLSLDWLAFWSSSDELERPLLPSNIHFPCLLQERSLSYGHLLPTGITSLPRCSLFGCDANCLCCAMSTFWMVYGIPGYLQVLSY